MPSTDSLEQVRKDLDEHRQQQSDQFDSMLEASKNNTLAVQQLTESTEGIVTLYSDLQSAARVGLALQKAVVWLGSIGAVGAFCAGALHYVFDFFTP